MKRLFTSSITLCLFYFSQAQNTGIGITTPRAKLHVFNGASGNITPYSPMVVESNANTHLNLLSPESNESGVLFGKPSDAASGGVIYNGVGTQNGLQFRTNGNSTKMVITNNGFVGIGTLSPTARLGFGFETGKKITLYPSSPGEYGIGMQNGLIQIYTDQASSDIAFGYDQGAAGMVEKFRFKGNGAFIVNGNPGSAGQILQSNGNAASPTWITPASPTNLLYNNTVPIQNTIATLVNGSSITLPFGHTFTTNTNTKVLVAFSFPIFAPSCFACGDTGLWVYIYLNGSYNRAYRIDVPNDKEQLLSGNALISVGPGTHTISFLASRFGPDIYVGHSGLTITAIYQIIPQ